MYFFFCFFFLLRKNYCLLNILLGFSFVCAPVVIIVGKSSYNLIYFNRGAVLKI